MRNWIKDNSMIIGLVALIACFMLGGIGIVSKDMTPAEIVYKISHFNIATILHK